MIFPNAGSRMFRSGDAFPPISPYRDGRPLGTGIPLRVNSYPVGSIVDPFGEYASYIAVPGEGSVDRLPRIVQALLWDGAAWDVDITLTSDFGGSITLNKTLNPGRRTTYNTGDTTSTVEDEDNDLITSIAQRYQRYFKAGETVPSIRSARATAVINHETDTPNIDAQISLSLGDNTFPDQLISELVQYAPDLDYWLINVLGFFGSIITPGGDCYINYELAGGDRDDSSILMMGYPLVCWVANGSIEGTITLAGTVPIY